MMPAHFRLPDRSAEAVMTDRTERLQRVQMVSLGAESELAGRFTALRGVGGGNGTAESVKAQA